MATPSLYLSYSLRGKVDGRPVSSGGSHRAVDIQIAGDEITDDVITVPTSTVVTLWDATVGGVTDFNLMLIEADRELRVELTIDANAGVGTRLQTFTLKGLSTEVAGEYGLPFLLASNAAFASDYTASFGAGTIDTIEKLVVKNESATNEVKVHRLIAT